MALSRVQYEADGSTDTFSVTFPYISKSDVKVSVGGTRVSFTWPTESAVKLSSMPSAGEIVDIKRETERENILVDFQDGSTLLENDLDLSARQSFFLAQESFDQTGSSMSVAEDGSLSASGRIISSLGYPDSDDDAATQGYVKDVLTDGENAKDRAIEAKNWANYPEDQLVPEGDLVDDYSSLHHRNKANDAQIASEQARDSAQASATESANSASAASLSETNAAESASNAATSESNSAALYDDFQDKFLGAKASNPTADNDGNPLITGALHWNTTDEALKIYDGEIWVVLDVGVEKTSDTGSAVLPAGTEAERDGSPLAGFFRFNTETNSFEGYTGTEWGPVGGGATGSSGDQVFVENDQIVTADYTVTSNRNAMSTGPIEVDNGVTVTIETGARWVVI